MSVAPAMMRASGLAARKARASSSVGGARGPLKRARRGRGLEFDWVGGERREVGEHGRRRVELVERCVLGGRRIAAPASRIGV